MEDAGPSTSGTSQSQPVYDQDKIVFAFEREYFSHYQHQEPPQKLKVGKNATGFFNPFQNGLQLRDQDLVDFLNERLGDHDETWAGKNVAAFLSREMIEELETCFQGLEPIAKLKIVLGFSQLTTKRLQDWKKEINTLLEIAARDPDDWVETISDQLRIFSPTGIIELEPTRNLETYRDALTLIYNKMSEYANKEGAKFTHVPESYAFCDDKVLEKELHYEPPVQAVHFTVKKKTKAELLSEQVMKELMEPKPAEDKNTLPMKYRSTARKPDLIGPMKGIVQPNAAKINGGFTSEPRKFPRQLSKREGGALLISIDDIPQAQMKRKKDADREERERKKEAAEAEKKRVEEEKKKGKTGKAELKRKPSSEQEKTKVEAAKKKKLMEACRDTMKFVKAVPMKPSPPLNSDVPPPKIEEEKKEEDPAVAFMDPSLELNRLRKLMPPSSSESIDEGRERMERSMMEKREQEKALEWMYHHDQLAEQREEEFDFHNKPRGPGLESRETIIQKNCMEFIESVTCCPLEQQKQIVAFIAGNKSTYRPMLGITNTVKIADSIQNGLTGDNQICRVRVESFMELNFESGEWRRQQRCKVLDIDEEPLDYIGTQCPRMLQHQVFNEISRNIKDEPEDKKFAGQSVIVQAYTPPEDPVLLSPGGSNATHHEVTIGQLTTVLTGICGCTGMRSLVNETALLSPIIIQHGNQTMLISPTQMHPQNISPTGRKVQNRGRKSAEQPPAQSFFQMSSDNQPKAQSLPYQTPIYIQPGQSYSSDEMAELIARHSNGAPVSQHPVQPKQQQPLPNGFTNAQLQAFYHQGIPVSQMSQMSQSQQQPQQLQQPQLRMQHGTFVVTAPMQQLQQVSMPQQQQQLPQVIYEQTPVQQLSIPQFVNQSLLTIPRQSEQASYYPHQAQMSMPNPQAYQSLPNNHSQYSPYQNMHSRPQAPQLQQLQQLQPNHSQPPTQQYNRY